MKVTAIESYSLRDDNGILVINLSADKAIEARNALLEQFPLDVFPRYHASETVCPDHGPIPCNWDYCPGCKAATRYYYLAVDGCVEPELSRTFTSAAARDEAARLYWNDGACHDEDAIFRLEVDSTGTPSLSCFSGAEMEAADDLPFYPDPDPPEECNVCRCLPCECRERLEDDLV